MRTPHIFTRCSTTGRINGIVKEKRSPIVFAIVGIAATAWFLIRVIPKPSRASYPCMQATAPVMSSFVMWVLSLFAIRSFYQKARDAVLSRNALSAGLTMITFLIVSATLLSQNYSTLYAAYIAPPPESNAPIGTGIGIFPGRVAWVHNPNAALWNGSGTWYAADLNPQDEYNKSFTLGLENLTDEHGDRDAWDAIFQWYNNDHGRAGTGYQPGDKIAVKINTNNAEYTGLQDADGQIDANPQTTLTVIRSLVLAGVPEEDIWVGDPSRAVTNNIFIPLHSAYPDVNIVDFYGNDGRVTTGIVDDIAINSDVTNGISKCFYDARYIVNVPLLKGHIGQGITFGSKNFYGNTGIKSPWTENGNKHPGTSAMTEWMVNPHFGGKTVLWAMDAMYPARDLNGAPADGWDGYPFNGKAAGSFIMSLDGVAEESVSLDFFIQYHKDKLDENGGIENAEEYIVAAAEKGAGVHEHWNNTIDRQYSGNLGGNGIELMYIDATQPVAVSSSSTTNSSSATETSSTLSSSPSSSSFIEVSSAIDENSSEPQKSSDQNSSQDHDDSSENAESSSDSETTESSEETSPLAHNNNTFSLLQWNNNGFSVTTAQPFTGSLINIKGIIVQSFSGRTTSAYKWNNTVPRGQYILKLDNQSQTITKVIQR